MEIRAKLGVLCTVWVCTILVRTNPEIQQVVDQVKEIVDQNIYTKEARLFLANTWEIMATWFLAAWFLKSDKKKSKQEEIDALLNLEHHKSFSIMTLDIARDGRLYPENQQDQDISTYFPWEQRAIVNIIQDRAKELDYTTNCVIIPLTEIEWKRIYPKIRDNQNIFQEDKLQTITNRFYGINRKGLAFLAVLSKAPRYRTRKDWSVEIVNDKNGADTSSKIRLLTVRKDLIDKTLEWCKEQDWGDYLLDCICRDKAWCCETVDDYIRYMLKDNINYVDNKTPVNNLLRDPLRRIHMVAIAQIARHIKNWGGAAEIYKEVNGKIPDSSSASIIDGIEQILMKLEGNETSQ